MKIIDMDSLIGKTELEVIDILKNSEFNYRIVRKDENYYVITSDFHTDRLNIEIDNDIVTKIYGG